MAKAGWNLEQFRARAHDSLEKHGGIDPAACEKLKGLLRYVDGDYNDAATFQAIRKELDGAQRPAHYLAIPPVMFEKVVEQLGNSGCARMMLALLSRSPSAMTCSLGAGTQPGSCTASSRSPQSFESTITSAKSP